MSEEIRNLSRKLKDFFERYSIYLILIFAFIIRLNGLNFGLPYLYNYDEVLIADSAVHMVATGDLNPHWFDLPGSFVMYLLAILFAIILAVYFIYCFLCGYVHNLSDFEQLIRHNPAFFFDKYPILLYFSGRLLMVSFAIITIYVMYLVAKRLFNKPAGILAAFCLAISPLHIGHSRYSRPDIPATMLIMFSVYFLVRFFEQYKNTKLLILSALFAGFSVAAKYTSGVIIFPILIYCLIADSQRTKLLTGKYLVDFFKIKTNLSRALLFIFIGFFIFAPFVILDFHHSSKDIIFQATRGTHLGAEKLPGLQNHLWYLKKALQEGIGGLIFAIFAGVGLCLILLEKSYKKYLFLIFPLLYYAIIVGWGRLKWTRWLIPVLPFEAISFGVGFYFCYKYFIQRRAVQAFKPIIFSLFVVILFLPSLHTIVYDVKAGIRLSRPDTRTIAKEWMEKNLPSGSKIAYEQYAPHLHINPQGDFSLIEMGWKKIVSQPLSYYKNQSVDYIIIVGSFKRNFYNKPDRYAKEISRYEELKNKAKLIKTFDNKENPGDVVEIYRLK